MSQETSSSVSSSAVRRGAAAFIQRSTEPWTKPTAPEDQTSATAAGVPSGSAVATSRATEVRKWFRPSLGRVTKR